MKKAASFETEKLARTEGAASPFFSPDGKWIGYFHVPTNEIYKVLVDGGEPLMVTKATRNDNGATWAPDNSIIFSAVGALKRVPESGGEAITLTKVRNADEYHLFPHMLPDGQTVLFTVVQRGGELNNFRLALYSFGDQDYRIILDEEGYNGVYSATGHILYGRSNRLMAVPFDLKNLRISGVPAPALDNVATHSNWGGMSYALSKEGTIIYAPGTATDDHLRSVLNVDLSGKATEFFKMRKRFEFARYSPDGNYVAFAIQENDNDANIWIYHIEGGALSQLTFYEGGGVSQFAWSPDSKTLAYATQAEDSTNSIYIRNIDGTGTAQKIYTFPLVTDMFLKDWSSDGKKLSFDHRNGSSWDISVYSFQDSSVKPFLATPAYEAGPNFSPNGKWIVYASNVSRGAGGGMEIYVRPYLKSSGGVWKISNGGGNQPVWSSDGKKIYYRNDNEMYSVDVSATDTFSKGNPEKIFEGNYFLPWARRFDIHPDGDRFIMIQDPTRVSVADQKIFVIQNFSEELKRLVPVGRN